jgi:hypothetical protein
LFSLPREPDYGLLSIPRPDFGGNSGGGVGFRKIGNDPNRKLGLRTAKVNDVTYACSHVVVYICISVLMNYDYTTHPILPFITITTKFILKHCIKSVLYTEMNDGYHGFNFTEKTFLRSVDPEQPKNVKFSLDLIYA